MTPDDVCKSYSDHSVALNLKVLVDEDDGEKTLVIEGGGEALKFLSELLMAVASSAPGDGFGISPFGAGRFHFSDSADVGLYISKRSLD